MKFLPVIIQIIDKLKDLEADLTVITTIVWLQTKMTSEKTMLEQILPMISCPYWVLWENFGIDRVC